MRTVSQSGVIYTGIESKFTSLTNFSIRASMSTLERFSSLSVLNFSTQNEAIACRHSQNRRDSSSAPWGHRTTRQPTPADKAKSSSHQN